MEYSLNCFAARNVYPGKLPLMATQAIQSMFYFPASFYLKMTHLIGWNFVITDIWYLVHCSISTYYRIYRMRLVGELRSWLVKYVLAVSLFILQYLKGSTSKLIIFLQKPVHSGRVTSWKFQLATRKPDNQSTRRLYLNKFTDFAVSSEDCMYIDHSECTYKCRKFRFHLA